MVTKVAEKAAILIVADDMLVEDEAEVVNVAVLVDAESETKWSESNKTRRWDSEKEEIDNAKRNACCNLWLL